MQQTFFVKINYIYYFYFNRSREKKVRVEGYVDEVVPRYSLDDFRMFFRMSRPTFELIARQVGTFLQEYQVVRSSGRSPITVETHLMIFLWYVGSLEPLCRIADRFNVTQFSVLNIRKRMCKVFLKHLKLKYIVWPTGQERLHVVNAFQEKKDFPGIAGAIDSTHIQIKPPKEHPQTYVNRKGYHSINLQCVCREDMRYIHCFAGWPGSCHDSRVLKNSDLWQTGQQLHNDGHHLIGDGGFPLKVWLMTPFRDNGHLTREQQHYNYCLSASRQVIERSFSLLKGRFRRLQYLDVYKVEVDVQLCISCCILHNICIMESDELDEYFNEDQVQPARNPQAAENDAAATNKRNQICQLLP